MKKRICCLVLVATVCCILLSACGSGGQGIRRDKVVFLTINVNMGSKGKADAKTLFSFMQESSYSFPVYFDTDYEASLTYGVQAIPVTLWIYRNGSFVHSYVGMLNEEYLVTYINKIMA